jgi:uncharacterized protein (TIGR04222 family)
MFPFNLPGSAFLVVYAALLLVATLGVIAWRRASEDGPMPKMSPLDPLQLAHLRGAEGEVVRCVVVSLVDRGLLTADGVWVQRATGVAPDHARRPIEQAVLARCGDRVDARDLLRDPKLTAACEPIRQALVAAGLLPSSRASAKRLLIALTVVTPYLAIAATKAAIGLRRGRPIELLVVFALCGAVLIVAACLRPRRTYLGDTFLADVRTFLSPLKARAHALQRGGADADVVLLVGAFGVAALPESTFGAERALFPRAAADSAVSFYGAGYGSSCASSCGGGGDGGGGCGGCGGGGD